MPLPAMLEIIECAKCNQKECLLIVIKRDYEELLIDESLINYEVRFITLHFNSNLKRIISLVKIIPHLIKIIFFELKDNGIVMTSNFDTLFQAYIAKFFKRFEIRHQIRDLNKLQLESGFVARLVQLIEKNMLKKVSKLIVSSPSFISEYYSKIFRNESLVIENIPRRDVWNNFKKKDFDINSFKIGFIGILRYKKSIKKLIETVEKLEESNIKVNVNFSGGSSPADLAEIKSYIKKDYLFNFSGPYQYARDIKKLHSEIDLIFAVYDEHDLNCKIALPNKLYEAMLSKIPILVAKNTFVGRKVEKLGIGESISIEKDDLFFRLKEIFRENESWYTSSLKNLSNFNTEEIYQNYNRAILKSINKL